MKTMKSRRPAGASSGGIRKRGPTRTDRDGDMDMDGSSRGGKRGRGDSSRRGAAGGRSSGGRQGQTRDRTLAIQQAIADNNKDSSQANVRQGKGGKGNSTQISITGWKNSNASSKRDGGIENLISFIERKLNAAPKGSRFRITKVSPTTSRVAKPQIFDCSLATPIVSGLTPKGPNSPLASQRSTMPKSLGSVFLIFASLAMPFQIILSFF